MSWPESLRQQIQARALGRCEYCLLHEADAGFPHQIDHVVSRKHRGTSDPDNLALACYLCNRFKGSDIASFDPATNELARLFNPRQGSWAEHFPIAGSVIEPLTKIGSATAHILQFNAPARVVERQALQALDRYPRSS
ncbi:MAG: HNH endonuclease [Verrucomicrobia bacterium]|nr:HNH endonuclease [Verrucomicrobiota bacterium]